MIGEYRDRTAFASISMNGGVWAKRYPDVESATSEARKLGLIDRLFAAAATRYVRKMKSPCVSALAGKTNVSQVLASGFRQAGGKLVGAY